MTADTRTTERTEARVETVTIEEIRCPVCEQWYAADDALTTVGAGLDYERDAEIVGADHLTRVCTACAESLFDCEPAPTGGRFSVVETALSRPLVDLGGIEVPARAVRTLVSVGITLAVAGIVANSVMTEVATQVQASEFQEVGAPLPIFEFLPVVVLGVLVIALIRAAVSIGPRGFR